MTEQVEPSEMSDSQLLDRIAELDYLISTNEPTLQERRIAHSLRLLTEVVERTIISGLRWDVDDVESVLRGSSTILGASMRRVQRESK